MFTG
ncbi:hypothetical protein VTL71DRAFT_11099 [Oculimacula yallundae]|jgi:hypothetical protein